MMMMMMLKAAKIMTIMTDDGGVPEDLLESQHSDNKVTMMKKVYPEAPL